MEKLLSLMLSAMLLLGLVLPAAQAEEPYNVVFTFAASGDLNRVNEVSRLVSAYTLDKIGCTVTLQPVSFANWNQKMNLVLASSGKQVDVISCLTGSFAGYTAKNQLVDMTQLVADIYPEQAEGRRHRHRHRRKASSAGRLAGRSAIRNQITGVGIVHRNTDPIPKEDSMKVFKNHVVEWSVTTEKQYDNPFRQVRMDADVTGPEGKTVRISGFWRGKSTWSFRFSSDVPGVYGWQTVCSDEQNADLHGKRGKVTVEEAENEQNSLYLHGRVRVSADGRHFAYADGTSFFWLCDSWTMFMTKRLSFEGLREWIRDRSEKHFNTVMVNLGEFPDLMPFDDRAESEAGFPWDKDFTTMRPEYYNEADRRIQAILEGGLTPFIVGSWGHLIQYADEELVHLPHAQHRGPLWRISCHVLPGGRRHHDDSRRFPLFPGAEPALSGDSAEL